MKTASLFERARTKIVATVGPATAGEDQLAGLIEAGADVFRINTAHGDRAQHEQRLRSIRAASERTGQPVAVLVDLAGPKIRLGELPGDELTCLPGQEVRFVRGESASAEDGLVTSYPLLVDELAAGDRVMLADGTVSFVVIESGGDFARCRVVQGGVVRSRQGVNLPGAKLSLPAITPADREHAAWASRHDVDFLGLSFVRTADEVNELAQLVAGAGSPPNVIAKIEKPEALDNLPAIISAADGVMVARGDLGVEIDVARMAVVQKRIIAACNRAGKPVIVATQMLDSMQHNRRPTRAEATDVANAVLDGADACMLSGETAVGEHPRAVVEMMHRIALSTEDIFRETVPPAVDRVDDDSSLDAVTGAVVRAAGRIARDVDARLVVVASHSGSTALALANCRNFVPTVGVSDRPATLRCMCLYWGVTPLPGAPSGNSAQLIKYIEAWGKQDGALRTGDRIVMVRGGQLVADVQNTLVVHEVPAE